MWTKFCQLVSSKSNKNVHMWISIHILYFVSFEIVEKCKKLCKTGGKNHLLEYNINIYFYKPYHRITLQTFTKLISAIVSL